MFSDNGSLHHRLTWSLLQIPISIELVTDIHSNKTVLSLPTSLITDLVEIRTNSEMFTVQMRIVISHYN